MAYSSVTYTSASGTTFALTNINGDPIPYIRQSDIKVYVNTVLQTLTTDYTFNTAGTAIVLNSPVSGATVLLQRITDITDPTVVYTAGSTLTAQDLNNADNQIRYGLQEFQDSVNAGAGVPDGDKGDIVVASNGTIWSIDAGVITEGKLATNAVTETKIGTGAVTSDKILNGTIVDVDINASAAIAGTKVNPNFGSQSIQTTGSLSTGAGTFNGDVTLNAQSDLRFADSDSSNWVAFQAPATVASNVTWTLPSADGTDGQKLSTNGSGVLSWTASVPNITYLTSGTSATYTPTTGTKAIYVEVIGAGGGGGGATGNVTTDYGCVAGGGASGAYCAKLITNLAQTFTYSVGTGGNGGAAGNFSGTTGGTSSFVASVTGTLTAQGGGGSSGRTATTTTVGNPGVAGTASGGDINVSSDRGSAGGYVSGLTLNSVSGGVSGFSAGLANSSNATATTNTEYGGGGAGAGTNENATSRAGGGGANGVIRITEFF